MLPTIPTIKVRVTTLALVSRLTILATLTTVAVLAPILGGHQQLISGPIVNATLFLAVIYTTPISALLVGILPSTVALATGLLPMMLAPIVPLIIIGNAVLITTFGKLRQKDFFFGVMGASFAKYIFLTVSTTIATKAYIAGPAATAATKMMTWAQFFTALLGGIIAYGVTKKLGSQEVPKLEA